MEALVAGSLLGPLIDVLCEKLASPDLIKVARSERINSPLDKWRNILLQIQRVLADAETGHINDRAVDLWRRDLQNLAYDIDDLLDDLVTEGIQPKLNQESYASTSTNKVLSFIPTCCTSFTRHTSMYGRKMSSKLDDITIKLLILAEQKNILGLDMSGIVNLVRPNRGHETTSLLFEPGIVGRKADKNALLGMLLGNEPCNHNVSVVSIVGIGGIGKTVLAQLLYDDMEVTGHFEIRVWICVSEEFDVFIISYNIFQSLEGRNAKFANLNMLQVALKEILSNKRFLLVLDDVWNENHDRWEILRRPFVAGAPGSKIIVTTRNTKVALVMGSLQVYHLNPLSKEEALALLAQHALHGRDINNPTLKSHVESIMEKCGGVPLALKMLGSMLRGRTDDEWEEVLTSKIWSLEGSGILPALRLSYHDLPLHLKQLFAYCCLFPKDYEFDKDELVLLWMAEGFLNQSNGRRSMESLGQECFEELMSKSFFQPSTTKQSRYIMESMINDLATSVAGEFFFRLDDKMDAQPLNECFEKFCHVSFIGKKYGAYRKFKELQRARRLRTFLPVSFRPNQRFHSLSDYDLVELLPQLPFLRVLSLTHHSITKIPPSIGSLKHMRYLNFSNTCIERLPEQVSDLCNLQSLLLCGCRELCTLPVSFAKLLNLRHLDINDTPRLNKMPLGLGGLTSLQTLPKVIIEGANGFEIHELKGLSALRGRLSISGLDKVIDAIQAADAELQHKNGLDDLEMRWSEVFDDSRNGRIEYDILERLRPHHELRSLKILFYGGMEFPSWVGDHLFDRLTELTFRGCRSCTHLPTFGCLPSLKVLKFDDMQGWQRWSSSVGDNDDNSRSFPCLHEVYIKDCPKLSDMSIGLIPSLRVLHIEGCSKEVLRYMVGVSSSIVRLTISGIKRLTQLHGEVLECLGAVIDLCIKDCDELRYLWESESEACKFLKSLQNLEVSSCKMLVSLGEKDVDLGISMESVREVILYGCKTLESYKCPNSVERLEICNCGSMASLIFSTVQELPSSLTTLHIGMCDNLTSFPEGCFAHLRSLVVEYCKHLKTFTHEHLQSLASLEELEMHDCPSIDYSFPYGLWPPKLRTLRIGCLNKPMSKWGLQNYPPSLVNLHLYGENSGVVSFAEAEDERNISDTTSSFLLPPSLTCLEINGFEDLKSVSKGLRHLASLERIYIRSCPMLRDLPKTTTTLKVTVY